MTSRERVAAALNFERPDRLPVSDALWDGLQDEWIAEGMPAGVSPADHFDWDISNMFLDISPRFPTRILARSGGMITYEDRFLLFTAYGPWEATWLSFVSGASSIKDLSGRVRLNTICRAVFSLGSSISGFQKDSPCSSDSAFGST